MAADNYDVAGHYRLMDFFNRALINYATPNGFGGANGLFGIVQRKHMRCSSTKLCRVIGRRELIADPRFAHNNSRTLHHADLEPILAQELLKLGRDEWLTLMRAADVPCGPVNSIADIAADPQIASREMITTVGGARYAAQPIRGTSISTGCENRAPRLGEHTHAILAWLGFSDGAIRQLASDKVV